ncbi:hypothetical protein EVAR_54751_1 [Eumeta japonica]|uniref:Uncharacterized protein n=1 Tax=Eumeta variegata TaxID=151549 RepID=A0A4C1YZJ4_EUMVA|nr:hypothetical protein EVAR_54751_1 [Eumeta japonica]
MNMAKSIVNGSRLESGSTPHRTTDSMALVGFNVLPSHEKRRLLNTGELLRTRRADERKSCRPADGGAGAWRCVTAASSPRGRPLRGARARPTGFGEHCTRIRFHYSCVSAAPMRASWWPERNQVLGQEDVIMHPLGFVVEGQIRGLAVGCMLHVNACCWQKFQFVTDSELVNKQGTVLGICADFAKRFSTTGDLLRFGHSETGLFVEELEGPMANSSLHHHFSLHQPASLSRDIIFLSKILAMGNNQFLELRVSMGSDDHVLFVG